MKIDAVRFAFKRFDSADLGFRDLARELEAKGYPSPSGQGLDAQGNVARLLQDRAYVGTARGAQTAWGKYHSARAKTSCPSTATARPDGDRKPQEDAIAVEGAHEGIIPVACSIASNASYRSGETGPPADAGRGRLPARRADLLRTLREADGRQHPARRRIGDGELAYEYAQYVCTTYAKFGRTASTTRLAAVTPSTPSGCSAGWSTTLQEVFLGPGRDALVQEIKSQLRAEPKANSGDVKRLEKRAADLDREVSRLVKAIRTLDAAELVEELAFVQAERDRVKAELAQAGRLTDPVDLDAEAERIADTMEIGEHLTTRTRRSYAKCSVNSCLGSTADGITSGEGMGSYAASSPRVRSGCGHNPWLPL